MKKNISLLFIVLILAIVLITPTYAAPTFECKYALNCPSDLTTVVFKTEFVRNSHAGINTSVYNYKICCGIRNGGVLSVMNYSYGNRGSCTSPTMGSVLSVSKNDDAHVAEYGQGSNYQNNICLSSTSGNITCQSPLPAICNPGYQCLASITDVSNAHIGKCNEYSFKICCKYFPDNTPYSAGDLNMGVGETGMFVFNITNTLSDSDIYTIDLSGSPSKIGYWSWFSGHRYDSEKNKMAVTLEPGETANFAVIVLGGEVGSGTINLVIKSALTGEVTLLQKNVDIRIVDDGLITETPEFGWIGYIIIAVIGAFLLI